MIHYYFIFCHVKFNPPIPIRAWEVNLSENWLKGICDHAPDEDHMGFEHFIGFLGDDDIESILGDDDI